MENKEIIMANAISENNQSITEQQPKKRSGELQNVGQAKTFALVDGLTLLGTVFGEALTPEHYEIYASVLGDLSPEELQYGFNRALRETKWWPKPSELLEFCTGRASAMADKLTIDNAWKWVCLYLEAFCVDGTPLWKVQGRKRNTRSIEAFVRDYDSADSFAVSAPFYEVARLEPPAIPEFIKQTLVGMSGSVKMGLTRISDAKRGWNSADNCRLSAKDSGFVRKDFDEHCSRVLAAAQANSQKTVSATLQLPGDVRPLFTEPTKTVMAYHINRDLSGYKASRLTLDEAKALYDGGTLSAPLYEETVNHYRKLERDELWRNTPLELNAVFLCPYDRNRLVWVTDSWPPPLGAFNIENATGTRVMAEYLPMAIGSLNLAIGETIRFIGKPSELRFSERPPYVFNLNEAVIKKENKHES